MKKFYLSMLFAGMIAFAASAQSWVVMQDFEGADAQSSIDLGRHDSNPLKGDLSIKEVAADENSNNHAAYITNKEWSTGILVKGTLPEGKTLADYIKVGFDVYNVDMNHKPLYLLVNGETVVSNVNNAIGGNETKGTWVKYNGGNWEFDIPADVDKTVTEYEVLVIFHAGAAGDCTYAIDNVRLLESGEPVGPVEPIEPGKYTESTNGTVTDGWLMAEDFQNGPVDAKIAVYNYKGNATDGCSASVIVDPASGTNLVGAIVATNWDNVFEVPVTLPEGKAIADYSEISFDLYRFEDDDNYKEIYVGVDNSVIYYKEKEYNEQAVVKTWTPKSYAVPETLTSGNEVKLYIGINTNKGHYAIDNVRLKERENKPEPDPVDFYETTNGDVNGGELMVNDFQHHGAVGVQLPTWTSGENHEGDVKTMSDPIDPQNIVGSFSGKSNYNTVHEMEVTLPEGKTLADYKAVKFDLYRTDKDAQYKRMRVYADDHKIYYKETGANDDYEEHTSERNVWEEKEYEIPEGHSVGNSFKLRLGIESDAPDYLIDNVRLVEKTVSTGIENVAADDNVNVTVSAGAIVLSGNGRTVIYTLTGQTVSTVAVDGVAEVRLPGGIYVVAFGSHAVKAIVR